MRQRRRIGRAPGGREALPRHLRSAGDVDGRLWRARHRIDGYRGSAGLAEAPVEFPQHAPVEQIRSRRGRRLGLEAEGRALARRDAGRAHVHPVQAPGGVVVRAGRTDAVVGLRPGHVAGVLEGQRDVVIAARRHPRRHAGRQQLGVIHRGGRSHGDRRRGRAPEPEQQFAQHAPAEAVRAGRRRAVILKANTACPPGATVLASSTRPVPQVELFKGFCEPSRYGLVIPGAPVVVPVLRIVTVTLAVLPVAIVIGAEMLTTAASS
jgi:hypothetical protein